MYFEVQVTLNCVFKNKELIQDFQQSTQPKIKLTQIFTAAIQTLTFKLRLANMIHSAHRFIQGCSHWCLLDLFSSWSLCWRIDSTESIHMSTWAPHLQTQSCKPHSLFVVLHAICPCQALNTQTNVRHKSVYILPKLPPSQLPFLQIRRSGCNSTLPFKRDCFPFQEHFLLIFNQSLCYWKSNYSCDRFSACLPGVDIEAGHLNLNSKFRSHA